MQLVRDVTIFPTQAACSRCIAILPGRRQLQTT
jgi:hypothetical protein